MDNELNDKIYQYGESFYNVEEIYKLINNMTPNKRKMFKDCISHFVLAQIFKKCNKTKESELLMTIANMEREISEKTISKTQYIAYDVKYSINLTKLFLMQGSLDKYKMSEFKNGEWLLNKLVSLTLGASHPKYEYEGFTIVDYERLTEKECAAIAENFKRNIRDESTVFFRDSKGLEKRRNN